MSMKKKTIQNLIRLFGFLIMIGAFIFIIERLFSLNISQVDFTHMLKPQYFILLFVSLLISILIVICNAYNWCRILSCFTSFRVSFIATFYVYAKSNLAKYLPGNIAHYVGRQVFGYSLGITQEKIVSATIFEIIYMVVAATLLSFIFMGRKLFEIASSLLPHIKIVVLIAILIFILLLIGAIIYFVIKRNTIIKQVLLFLKAKEFWLTSILVIILYCCTFIMNGVMLTSIIGLNITLNISKIGFIIAASIISWLIGFITPGVPGGIGVRESVLILILSPLLPNGIILLAALLQRIVMILGDIFAWILSLLINRMHNGHIDI